MSELRHHAAQLVLWRHLQTCQHSDTMQLSWYSGDTCKHVSTQTPCSSVGTLATPANMAALRHHAAQLVLWRHLQTWQHSDTMQLSWYSGDTCKHVSTQTPCRSVGTLATLANMSALRHHAAQLVLWRHLQTCQHSDTMPAQLVLWRHLQTCQHSDTMQLSWYSGDTCKHVSTQTPCQLSWYSGDTCKHVSTQTPCQLSWYSGDTCKHVSTQTPCSSVGTLATPANMSALRHHAAQLVLWRHLQTCQHSDTMQLSWYSGDTCKHVSTQTPCSSVGTLATPTNMSELRHHAAQLVLWRHLQTCQNSDTMQLSWYSGDTCKHGSTQKNSLNKNTFLHELWPVPV